MAADALPLSGRSGRVSGAGPAATHARRLLRELGALISEDASDATTFTVELGRGSALADWATSGAMALTGRSDGPPIAAPGAPAAAVRGALAVFAALRCADGADMMSVPAAEVLGERAALAGLTRRGPWSAGGAFRALPTRDGFLGISLPRPDDLELVPALTERDVGDPWSAVATWARTQAADAAAERAQLLGMAAAAIPEQGAPRDEQRALRDGRGIIVRPGGFRRNRRSRPLVVDLTSLWAGPLCAHLLGLTGAEVIKVESTRRPDGARYGCRAFYDLMHGGHASVSLDFTASEGISALHRLISAADIVLEASRPRALRRLGIDAEAAVAEGTTWLSITAYGRSGPWSDRVGFGDDVAAAAGSVVRDSAEILPCGDALADPVTGVHAAAAAAAALLSARAYLIDVSMRDVLATATVDYADEPHEVVPTPDGGWLVRTADSEFPIQAPSGRQRDRAAAALGADNDTILSRWAS